MGADERLGSPAESRGEDATIVNEEKRTSLDDEYDGITSEKAGHHGGADTSGETDGEVDALDAAEDGDEDGGEREDGGNVTNTLSRATTKDEDYITGYRLILVIASVCLVMFLMLLDISIVTTVRPAARLWFPCPPKTTPTDSLHRPSLE
jgi:hypothetical protein